MEPTALSALPLPIRAARSPGPPKSGRTVRSARSRTVAVGAVGAGAVGPPDSGAQERDHVAPAGDGARSGREAAEAGTATGVVGQTGIPPLRPVTDRAGGPVSLPALGPATAHGETDEESADAIELRQATRRLLATCVEVVGGYRPVVQLRPFCQPERFDSIVNRLLRPAGGSGRGHGATRASVVAGHGGPPRAGRGARTGPGDRVTVRRVQICDVSDGVAETRRRHGPPGEGVGDGDPDGTRPRPLAVHPP